MRLTLLVAAFALLCSACFNHRPAAPSATVAANPASTSATTTTPTTTAKKLWTTKEFYLMLKKNKIQRYEQVKAILGPPDLVRSTGPTVSDKTFFIYYQAGQNEHTEKPANIIVTFIDGWYHSIAIE
jgi:hypothetical protein